MFGSAREFSLALAQYFGEDQVREILRGRLRIYTTSAFVFSTVIVSSKESKQLFIVHIR